MSVLQRFAHAVGCGKAPEQAATEARITAALEAIADARNALVPAYIALGDIVHSDRALSEDEVDAWEGMKKATARLTDARRQLEGLLGEGL